MVLKSTLLKIYEKFKKVEFRKFSGRSIYSFIFFYFLSISYLKAYDNRNDRLMIWEAVAQELQHISNTGQLLHPARISSDSCFQNAIINGGFDNDLADWSFGNGWFVEVHGGNSRGVNYRGEQSGVNKDTGSSLEQRVNNAYINSEGYMLLTFDFRFTLCQGCTNDLFHASLEVVYDGITYARFQNGYLIPTNGAPVNGAILETTPDLPFATQSNSNSGSMLSVKLHIPTSNPDGILSFVHNKGGGEDDVNLDNIYVEALCPPKCPEGINCYNVKTTRIK